jgi:hypothetical protein
MSSHAKARRVAKGSTNKSKSSKSPPIILPKAIRDELRMCVALRGYSAIREGKGKTLFDIEDGDDNDGDNNDAMNNNGASNVTFDDEIMEVKDNGTPVDKDSKDGNTNDGNTGINKLITYEVKKEKVDSTKKKKVSARKRTMATRKSSRC